jgi:hypothetical protein
MQLPVLPTSPLPPLYDAWVYQLLAGPIPFETDATCSDCAMCSKDDQSETRSEMFYNPDVKCCSYTPVLPNYIVGRILNDDDPNLARGRQSVAARLRARLAVTPLGLGMPPTYNLIYTHTAGKTFGRSEALRCPHYLPENGGSCGIWKHRTGVCATWHCKYVRGAVGSRFWAALNHLLSAVEQSLSQWCVYELEIDLEGLRELFPLRATASSSNQINSLSLDGKVDPRTYELIWGRWSGREVEFYSEAARRVNGMNWQEVVSLGGPEVKIRERLVKDSYAKLMSTELPPSLKVGGMQVMGLGHESCRVTTYSEIDPLELPQTLVSILPYFDGGPTLDTIQAIEEQEGLRLDSALVRKLADFEVLVPGESQ